MDEQERKNIYKCIKNKPARANNMAFYIYNNSLIATNKSAHYENPTMQSVCVIKKMSESLSSFSVKNCNQEFVHWISHQNGGISR